MEKIRTSARKLRQGVSFSATTVEVRFVPTGHLSVALYDASGAAPLANKKLTVDIPDEGTVSLVTDDEGRLFHADVPYQDYELRLDGGGSVFAPAVSARAQVHRRHVPGELRAYVDLLLRDDAQRPLAGVAVTLSGPGGDVALHTDDSGAVAQALPAAPGKYTLRVDGHKELAVELPAVPRRRLVVLEKDA